MLFHMEFAFPTAALEQFISPQCDRMHFIIAYLKERGVQAVVMPSDGRNHIYIVFPKSSYNQKFRIKTVLAHYDRAEGSPGANDNSFAVCMLMNWACRLNTENCCHNIRLIFTDGEEIGGGKAAGINQGAFSLAKMFRRLGICGDDVFVFDCMGRGLLPVLAKVTLPHGITPQFKKQFEDLFRRTVLLLQSAYGSPAVLPVSYSDNAGFIANGIPAVCVTMLPFEEAASYASALMQNAALEQYVTNKKCPTGIPETVFYNSLPYTWRLFHTADDSAQTLTAQSAAVFERILNALSKMNTLRAENKKDGVL